ncbi:hypothetical protein EPUS_07550 [Endocarpon pusillum Z07020]|uniref:Uncharacterized protein n=1 Tax=Endocarpon pusillum (strain Z07020 / HMAS-L-300199) TaxID=1263415 RepID=U1GJP9_ENDPU|nr:uncharacterized protein EPUS_07550 [Endocarpon pusillum Z07020]ERF72388.1 hypothetical protein EPUS_07550 [Endocarpon pusillum Z07020]
MGWLWGGNKNNDDRDPTRSLDPTLKEFLNSQQPRPYVPAQAPPAAQPQPQSPLPKPSPSPQSSPNRSPADTNANVSPSNPIVPPASLFPDGRYAHLWSTYTPQDSITATTSSPLERLVSARKDRRELLSRAALENCAFEHELQQTCFTSGSAAQRAKARMTMCREETKAFNRCYALQGKFLQALGYMSRAGSSDDDEERIQMHADKLYHRMMDYEAAVDRARRSGTPQLVELEPALVEKKIRELQMQQGLEELPPHERELAVRAALQEAKMTYLYSEEMKGYAREMDGKRKERQRRLSRLVGEPIGRFVIPDPPPDQASGVRRQASGVRRQTSDSALQTQGLPL